MLVLLGVLLGVLLVSLLWIEDILSILWLLLLLQQPLILVN